MHQWPATAFHREIAGDEEHRIFEPLVAGGDSRLDLDQQGVNKYLCPPLPSPAIACLSSCTASPISEAGFEKAWAAYRRIAEARSAQMAVRRIKECEADIEAGIRTYLRLRPHFEVVLTPSGTDGVLLAAALLTLEGGGKPLTAILPSPSETGSGVPMAAACRMFDGPEAGRPVFDEAGETIFVAVRGPDGFSRHTYAEDFRQAALAAGDRSVLYLTHGTKTGLVRPIKVPSGIEVIVDACQLRMPPTGILECLGEGWPVVITGSKFLGGPAFCGAVLLPPGRFSAKVKQQAQIACATSAQVQANSADEQTQAKLGPLLRWTAALADVEMVACEPHEVDDAVRRLEREARKVVAALPGVRVVDSTGVCSGIVTFAVEAVGRPGGSLSAAELRPLYRALADHGVLIGQPVDLGPFGGLRVAIGLRDVLRGSIEASLQRLADAWPLALEGTAAPARAA